MVTAGKLKSVVRRAFPWLVPVYRFFLWRLVLRPRYRRLGMDVFRDHYHRNSWGHPESVSGSGSTLAATVVVRSALPALVSQYGVKSILDAPCGDFNWMRMLDLPVTYIGADVVPELIEANNLLYASEGRSFEVLDITVDSLPRVDLVVCRDLLFHFSFADAERAVRRIKQSGSSLLLTTTYPGTMRNVDVPTGDYRRINLEKPPFLFPPPLMLVGEQDLDGSDKSLGLWRIADL